MLYGCGGGEEQNQDLIPAPPVNANIYAQDTVNYFSTTGLKRVDLSNRVSSATGTQLKLVDVKPLSKDPACRAVTIDGQLSFSIQQSDSIACDYSYRIQDPLGMYQDQATSRVVINERSSTLPPPVAPKSMLLNENESQSIDLSYTDPQGKAYQLLDDIILLGSGSIDLDTLNNSLIYTAAEKGTSRILYQLRENSGTKILLGSIDIAVSNSGNLPPYAAHIEYGSPVKPGQEIVIDVANFITGEPGEQLQLTYVDSFDAWVEPYDRLDVTNTKFSFYTNIPGDYFVTYTIDDHRGGLALGMVKIVVENFFTDITLTDPDGTLTFLAPLSQYQASKLGMKTECKPDTSVDYSGFCPAQMSVSVAKAYCHTRGGRLPTAEEMMKLNSSGNASGYWPTDVSYWTNYDNKNGQYVDLNIKSGNATFEDANSYRNITCLAGNLEYLVELGVEKNLKTNSIIPVDSLYYTGFDNVKMTYSGNIDWRVNNGIFQTEVSVVGDAISGYSISTGRKIGTVPVGAVFMDPPLQGLSASVTLNITADNDTGFIGQAKGDVSFFNFVKGGELYCVQGLYSLKGLGVPGNYVEDITTWSYPKIINLDRIREIQVQTGEYSAADWDRVITTLAFRNPDGSFQYCTAQNSSTQIRNVTWTSIPLLSNEYLSGIEIHHNPFIYGIRLRTTKSIIR